MFLLDTGARRAELVGLRLADLDLDLDVALVLGKGRRERALPFGRKTAVALDRYLRVRARHRDAELPWLWLGQHGPLGPYGVRQILRRSVPFVCTAVWPSSTRSPKRGFPCPRPLAGPEPADGELLSTGEVMLSGQQPAPTKLTRPSCSPGCWPS
jgi:hypothetical protein